jgi:hypothetical protein
MELKIRSRMPALFTTPLLGVSPVVTTVCETKSDVAISSELVSVKLATVFDP